MKKPLTSLDSSALSVVSTLVVPGDVVVPGIVVVLLVALVVGATVVDVPVPALSPVLPSSPTSTAGPQPSNTTAVTHTPRMPWSLADALADRLAPSSTHEHATHDCASTRVAAAGTVVVAVIRLTHPSAVLLLVLAVACGGSPAEDPAESTTGTTDDPSVDTGTAPGESSIDPADTTAADSSDSGPGDDSSSDDGSTGDPPVVGEPCGEGPWTCVPVEPMGPYGTQTFDVPAAQNWVNTGLFLHAGEQATIDESGAWEMGPDTGITIDHGACVVGDLVARIGLNYKDPQLTCVAGAGVVFTADKDGVLFVGGLPSNDLGETYETRRFASGSKSVTVTSVGATVPTVESAEAATYPYGDVASGWVELRGDHTIVTMPTALVGPDAAVVGAALDRIDAFYELHEQLRGAVPQQGQRIRFIPDPDVVPLGYMLAGNPVRMDPILVDPTYANRISQAGMPGVDVWGFAHELGHDFTFVNGLWWYRENSLESWPNLFSMHALEALGLPQHDEIAACPGSAPVAYASWDAWDGLCFLLQFQYAYGWEFYASYFEQLNTTDPATVPSGPGAWTFVHDRFEAIAQTDITPTFVAWSVPNPG